MKLFNLLIITLLLLIPYFWFNNLFLVGSDDGHIYFFFPKEMFNNYLLNLPSNNMLSSIGFYFPQYYQAIFVLIICIIKILLPLINVQSFFLGLNLSLGFLSFNKLLSLWIKDDTIKIISSLSYALSLFTFTLWVNQLYSLYLIAIMPILIYYLLKLNLTNTLILSLLISITIFLLLSIPWILGLIISLTPFIINSFLKNKKEFTKNITLLIILVLIINQYILFFIYDSLITSKSTDILSNGLNNDFRKMNIITVKAVSARNTPLYPLLNLFHKNLQKDFNWNSYKIYESWNLKLMPINLLFLTTLLLPLFYLRKISHKKKKFYLLSLYSWLIAIYFFTVNITQLGLDLFIKMTINIPGFVMFRNMFGKFSLAMAFTTSLLLSSSLNIIKELIKNYKRILIILTIIILLNSIPFIKGDYINKKIWTTNNTYNTITDFNKDFYDLVNYIKEMNTTSRFLWYPLNQANYIQIRDENKTNHYYSGVSPLLFLTGKNDLNGFLSFPTNYQELLKQKIITGKISEVLRILQKMNIEYIIINNDISDDLKNSYLYKYNETINLYEEQKKYEKIILGEHIKDFGQRYSLYKINNSYESKLIYLTTNKSEFPTSFENIDFKRESINNYTIKIKTLNKTQYLVFLDPYNDGWELLLNNKELRTNHTIIFDYANSWELNNELFNKTNNITLTLYFRPQEYVKPLITLSIITVTLILLFLISEAKKSFNKNNNTKKDNKKTKKRINKIKK